MLCKLCGVPDTHHRKLQHPFVPSIKQKVYLEPVNPPPLQPVQQPVQPIQHQEPRTLPPLKPANEWSGEMSQWTDYPRSHTMNGMNRREGGGGMVSELTGDVLYDDPANRQKFSNIKKDPWVQQNLSQTSTNWNQIFQSPLEYCVECGTTLDAHQNKNHPFQSNLGGQKKTGWLNPDGTDVDSNRSNSVMGMMGGGGDNFGAIDGRGVNQWQNRGDNRLDNRSQIGLGGTYI